MILFTDEDSFQVEFGRFYEIQHHAFGSSTSRNFVMEIASMDVITTAWGVLYPPKHHRKVYDLDSGKIREITAYGYTGLTVKHILKMKECTDVAVLRALMIDATTEI